jgi:hypothetical protein
MIISRVEREALYDAYLAIDGLAFPSGVAALCHRLGEALTIARVPTMSDVEAGVAQLEASADGLATARVRVEEADGELARSWSGEAAQLGRAALADLDSELAVLAATIRDEIAVGAADLRAAARQAASTVETARLRMIRAFSLTPQLRSQVDGDARTARYAALFSLVKTEAKQGLTQVMDAYQEFDQASYRFIETARRAERTIRPDRHARTGGFLA